EFPEELLAVIPQEKQQALIAALELDPRPSYQNDDQPYGVPYAGWDVRFRVKDDILTVYEVVPMGTVNVK
ncbi:MAG: tRNA (N6-threonylcarbamoyladenosine(37)-N6)-methyltransferase TrmO, partial [Christensenellaceae bacterium]|nr:tRNA (N6-threonylcarbamoyladenosine(37)-N6)-methyltransferase TrmO [Christensenellaceae bacterium]